MDRKKLPYPLFVSIAHKDAIIFQKTFDECPIILGRNSKCDIALTNFDFLSRQHCSITVENNLVKITDLDSSNGLYFEGKKVKEAIIKNSSQIEIGEILIKIELLKVTEEQATVVTVSFENEKTAIKNISQKIPECPVVNAAKSFKKEDKKESGRIPFTAIPPKALEDLPKMVHFDGVKHFENNNDLRQKNSTEAEEAESISSPNGFTPQRSKSKVTSKPIKPHPQAAQLRPQQRVLESYITWKDQIYDLQQFYAGDRVIIGPEEFATIELPILKKNIKMAMFDGMNTQVYIPQTLKFELESDTNSYSFEEAAFSPNVTRKKNYYTMKLGPSELVSVQLSPDVSVHLRYAPAPRQLANRIRLIKDEEMKIPGVIIGALEFFIFFLIFFTKTKEIETPQKIIQKRVARLIIEQKSPPPPPERKKPEPPKKEKIAQKKKEPPRKPRKVVRRQPKPKKIVRLQKSKILSKINKYPVEVEKPLRAAKKPVVTNIKAVGALAALGAISSKNTSKVPVAININKNAGGQRALNTGGVIGTLKTSTGKLAAGGMASVKTKGLGYGTGKGYGVQGIKGTAGSRAVAGVIVGAPSLIRLSKEDGLSRQQVMDVVKRYMTQIQQCYERSLIDNPGLAGRIEYEWEITSRGSVKWAKVRKSDMSGADRLNKCVTKVFKKMKFPVAKNGQNTIPNIGFPFGRL